MDFCIELYREHLEEGSFLYDQRGALFTDPGLTWMDLEEFEGRLDAHADALVVGGEPALEVCREQALGGDPGELHMATRVFCRQDRFDLLTDCLQNFSLDDGEHLRAVRNALNHEMPGNWIQPVDRLNPIDLRRSRRASDAAGRSIAGRRSRALDCRFCKSRWIPANQPGRPVDGGIEKVRGTDAAPRHLGAGPHQGASGAQRDHGIPVPCRPTCLHGCRFFPAAHGRWCSDFPMA